jgi:hypothetical protein
MDFLFAKDRNPWVFMDKEATKVGAIFDRDMEHGEAFTAFDEKTLGSAHMQASEYEHATPPEEPERPHMTPQEPV